MWEDPKPVPRLPDDRRSHFDYEQENADFARPDACRICGELAIHVRETMFYGRCVRIGTCKTHGEFEIPR